MNEALSHLIQQIISNAQLNDEHVWIFSFCMFFCYLMAKEERVLDLGQCFSVSSQVGLTEAFFLIL